MFRNFLFSLAFLFTFSFCSNAQDITDSTDTVIIDTDSTEYHEEGKFDTDKYEEFEDFEVFEDEGDVYGMHLRGKPTLELSYGMTKNKIKSMGNNFFDNGSASIKLGYSTSSVANDYVLRFRQGYLFAGNYSQDLRKKQTGGNKADVQAWRFGVGAQEAYGYTFGNFSVIPYSSGSLVWTRIKIDANNPALLSAPAVFTPNELKQLSMFDESFRFGTAAEGGIKIQFVPLISLNASYERQIVFPRYMVWKHLGSMVIEFAGQAGIDAFIREVMDSSPAAAPVLNFLLKNGFSYALYQLRQEKMNWPFDTAEPFSFDTFNVGMTFTF